MTQQPSHNSRCAVLPQKAAQTRVSSSTNLKLLIYKESKWDGKMQLLERHGEEDKMGAGGAVQKIVYLAKSILLFRDKISDSPGCPGTGWGAVEDCGDLELLNFLAFILGVLAPQADEHDRGLKQYQRLNPGSVVCCACPLPTEHMPSAKQCLHIRCTGTNCVPKVSLTALS